MLSHILLIKCSSYSTAKKQKNKKEEIIIINRVLSNQRMIDLMAIVILCLEVKESLSLYIYIYFFYSFLKVVCSVIHIIIKSCYY